MESEEVRKFIEEMEFDATDDVMVNTVEELPAEFDVYQDGGGVGLELDVRGEVRGRNVEREMMTRVHGHDVGMKVLWDRVKVLEGEVRKLVKVLEPVIRKLGGTGHDSGKF